MRTIDSAMQGIINGHTKRPAMTMTIEDHILHYTGYKQPNVADGYMDSCISPNNSIIRCYVDRVSGSGPFSRTFYYQVITDPTNASQWSTWTEFPAAHQIIFQDASCAISNNGGTIYAFCQNGSTNYLVAYTSTNNGASWSGPLDVLLPPGSALIRGIGSAGNNDVFFIYDVSGGDNLGASFWNGSSWSSIFAWTLPKIQAGAGLSVVYHSSVYIPIYSDGYDLFSCLYDPVGNTWNQDSNIAPATSTAIARIGPRVSFDSTTGLWTAVVVEADSGAISGAVYSYPRLRQSSDLVHWSNGTILPDVSGSVTYGVTMFHLPSPNTGSAGDRYYISMLANVFSAPGFSSSNSQHYVDVSAAVLSYKRVEKANKPATIEVIIDNASGQYNGYISQPGAYRPIGPNTSIVVSEGYYTGGPPPSAIDVIQTSVYHINQIHIERTPEENQIKLVGLDKSRLLDYESRFQNTSTNKNIGVLLNEVVARAGLFALTVPGTSQIGEIVPQFVLQAGRPYRAALDELCTTYGLYYFLDQNETLVIRELSSSDGSIWTYQPEIELVSFVTIDLRANHLVVSGKPPTGGQAFSLTTSEAYDGSHNAWVGQEQLLHEIDHKLTNTTETSIRASLSLAREQRSQYAHLVNIPLNPALQIFDVVTLIDSAAGQNLTARIIEQEMVFDAEKADYYQLLALEGV